MSTQLLTALTAELVEYMEGAVSLLIGTRDAALRPESGRAWGIEVERESAAATVFLPVPGSALTLANLRDNGHIALTFSRGIDHRSVQVKGHCFAIAASDERQRALQDRYFATFSEGLRWIGHRPPNLRRVRYFPSHALSFRIESMYEQTPGPGAGRGFALGAP
ncbi:MAG: hypothetical protein ABW061_00640 [Polyangiaceae bacterium]